LTKYKGYAGKILRVDLTSRTFGVEPLPDEFAEKFLGGEGIGAKILWDELGPGVDPLSPNNKLIFTLGPLTGAQCPSVSRTVATTKSPLTNTLTRSFAGGHFSHELKRAGYDGIIFEGKSDAPVYVWIKDDKVEIKDAGFLWGMSTGDTQKFVKNYTDQEAQVACIGPGGENLVKFASIISGMGVFGRGGVGTVMGSKNLKAIVVRGTKEPELADPSGYAGAVRKVYGSYASQKAFADNWRTYGTSGTVNILEPHGNWPTRNFQSGVFPESRDTLYREHWRKSVKKDVACAVCPVTCKKIAFTGSEGPFAGITSEGLEYETIWAFGALCGNNDLKAVAAADRLCDELGVDTISTGNVIGFAMELYQKRVITSKDTEGLHLDWGNTEAMVAMIKKIVYKKGLGAVLAEGVAKAAEIFKNGSERYAMHVKGLELPGYDPRGQFGMGLNYATANRGGCHCSGYTTFVEVTGPVNPYTAEGKGELIFKIQNDAALRNSAVLCTFGEWITRAHLPELLKTETGLDYTKEDLSKMGERIFNLERAFNVREGFSRADDTLPARLLEEPLKEGKSKDHVVKLEAMLEDYYRVRGWDQRTGVPTKSKLEELGLGDVADELDGVGKLPA